MLGRINHIGIATSSIDGSIQLYHQLFGVTDVTRIGPLPAQGVSVAFINFPGTQIELIEPYGTTSPLRGFLAKNPKGGQHHVCFEVSNILAARDAMLTMGASLLGTGEPRLGAHGTPVIFLHPAGTGGVLIELMQISEGAR